jgi:alpha-ribazole phosphatase
VERLTARFAARDVVAVAHGGTIRAALAQALALPAERALGFVIDTCSLTRLDHVAPADGPAQWRIVGVNLRLGQR